MPQTAHVVTPWKANSPDPLALNAGDRVQVEDRDSEWPGWVWCQHPNGKTGWVPARYLDRTGDVQTFGLPAVARRDYDAHELDVAPGDELTLLEFESGWYLALSASGQRGWVPAENLRLAEPLT